MLFGAPLLGLIKNHGGQDSEQRAPLSLVFQVEIKKLSRLIKWWPRRSPHPTMLAARDFGQELTDFRYRVTMVSELGRKHVSLCGPYAFCASPSLYQPLNMIGPPLERFTLLVREFVSLINANDTSERSGNVIEHLLDHRQVCAKLGQTASNCSAQIVYGPGEILAIDQDAPFAH